MFQTLRQINFICMVLVVSAKTAGEEVYYSQSYNEKQNATAIFSCLNLCIYLHQDILRTKMRLSITSPIFS